MQRLLAIISDTAHQTFILALIVNCIWKNAENKSSVDG